MSHWQQVKNSSGALRTFLSLPRYYFIFLLTCATFVLLLYEYQLPPLSPEPTFLTHFPPDKEVSSPGIGEIPTLIQNTKICQPSDPPIRVLVLITSFAEHFQLRRKLRELVPENELRLLGMRRVFLLARTTEETTTDLVHEESLEHGDILLGDFTESYRNLTYKHVMGLQFGVKFCFGVDLILKQDDDIFVDYFQLPKFIPELKGKDGVVGKVLPHQEVIREPASSKWRVNVHEYSGKYFPPFVSGWAYLLTPRIAKALVEKAAEVKPFWIDDVHVTGTLREKVGVNLSDISEQFTIFKGQLQCCVATSRTMSSEDGPYWCDYLVGPVNGDMDLMELLHRQAQFCYAAGTCRWRERKLEKTCVVTPGMVVNKPAIIGWISPQSLLVQAEYARV